ncbi:DJ-1/PfpI family protein [Nocardiopsis suaedae]|uniref:DJ-1/PfpI family protein n=1 Tax=Nocardiopsis suaedae TaxID=3018444 RepID=A0ABT4TPY9_9ACTN|nr:DJ-1/PfpI family protein [Nocardiopsis suaedae]MDA2806756.1 DJ-1/PfpI family protein [Nocardiopsis suaedae]
MQIAIVVYDRFTALDAVGPYELLSRLPGAETVVCAEERGPVRSDTGVLGVSADAALEEVRSPDIVLVPGGPGQRLLMEREPLLEWLRAVDAGATWMATVCTGSLLLAAAGLLRGRPATTHWAAMEGLSAYGAVPLPERVVRDGKYVTAAGVSAGIDMALELCGRIEGEEFAQALQLAVEYDPQPPYDAGSPAKAPEHLVRILRENPEKVLGG